MNAGMTLCFYPCPTSGRHPAFIAGVQVMPARIANIDWICRAPLTPGPFFGSNRLTGAIGGYATASKSLKGNRSRGATEYPFPLEGEGGRSEAEVG